MRSNAVVVGRVRSHQMAKMQLAEHDNVVKTFPPDRSDQPFGKSILPGRGWCGRLVPDAHGAQSACDDAAIDAVPIADQVVGSLIPRKGLADLACDPLRRRIGRDVDPDEISAVNPYNHEAVQQFEANGRDYEQIHGGNVLPDLEVHVA